MDENELLEEFTIEALELIEDAETGLLKIDKDEDYDEQYNLIFRSFHSLKGASGMMGVDTLQHYVHEIETNFQLNKDSDTLSKDKLDYFLDGVDKMRDFLNANIQELVVSELVYPQEGVDSKIQNTKPEVSDKIVQESKHQKVVSSLKKRKSGKIYIVDDEPDIIEIIEDFLEDENLTIETFDDSQNLIDTLEVTDEIPNLIISDFNMPKYNGEQLLDYVNENIDKIPFLFISGFLDKSLVIKLIDKGAIGFLDKPFEQEDLIKKVKTALIKSKSSTLIELAIETLIGNFGELEDSMKKNGKEKLLTVLKGDMEKILDQRKELEDLQKGK